MNGIKWQEPPPDGRTNGNTRASQWAVVADELKALPGEWALIAEGVSATLSSRIKAGQSAFAPAGSFESVVRNRRPVNGTHVFDVYARFVGEQVSA